MNCWGEIVRELLDKLCFLWIFDWEFRRVFWNLFLFFKFSKGHNCRYASLEQQVSITLKFANLNFPPKSIPFPFPGHLSPDRCESRCHTIVNFHFRQRTTTFRPPSPSPVNFSELVPGCVPAISRTASCTKFQFSTSWFGKRFLATVDEQLQKNFPAFPPGIFPVDDSCRVCVCVCGNVEFQGSNRRASLSTACGSLCVWADFGVPSPGKFL